VANPTGGLFQTLVAAMSNAAANLTYANEFINSIYWEHKPVVSTPYTTLNVIIPTVDEADVADIGSGAIQVTDTDHNSVSIPYDKHFSTSFVIKAWDQNRTPQDLERTYLKPRLEALARSVNRSVASLFTTTAFGTGATPVAGYALETGATAGHFTRADVEECWENMVLQGVPMEDSANLKFITTPASYGGMLADTTLSYQYIVGQEAAAAAQQQAKLQLIYGARPVYDQHLSQLAVALGFTAAKEPGILMHKYCAAGVTAQPPSSDNPAVRESIQWIKDVLPVQMQVGYSMEKQGTIVHLHCYWGTKVVRADYASFTETV
jgi:hypothetical protein